MLPLLAVLMFSLLSLAALSGDLGLAAAQQNRLEMAADSVAMAAARAEARIHHDLELGLLSSDQAECARDAECRRSQLVPPQALSLAYQILGVVEPGQLEAPDADVELRPGAIRTQLDACSTSDDPCWSARVDQAIPLFFGQGSLIGFQDSSLRELRDARDAGTILVGDGAPRAGSLRARGVPIGAISRAAGRPVVRVGLPQPLQSRFPGRAPFALSLDTWRERLEDGLPQALEVDGQNLLLSTDVVGRRIGGSLGLCAGTRLSSGSACPGEQPESGEESLFTAGPYLAYAPLYDQSELVVGFGYVRVEASNSSQLTLRRLRVRTAPVNASASPRGLVGSLATASVLEAHAEIGAGLRLTPVLR